VRGGAGVACWGREGADGVGECQAHGQEGRGPRKKKEGEKERKEREKRKERRKRKEEKKNKIGIRKEKGKEIVKRLRKLGKLLEILGERILRGFSGFRASA
jgi:ribosomal protein S4